MKEERFFCDKCKELVFAQSDLKSFQIECGYTSLSGLKVYVQYKLCLDCAEKIGAIERFVLNDKPIVQPVPDLKDRLFDIMAELVAHFKEE